MSEIQRDSAAGPDPGRGEFLYGDITGKTIGAAFEVWRVLGYGFLEKVYENALVVELESAGLSAQPQQEIQVRYKGRDVGFYKADVVVEGKVIVGIKAERCYSPVHEAQLLNYLKATGARVGLILNFGERKCEHKRLIR